jgi:hypothetical protein
VKQLDFLPGGKALYIELTRVCRPIGQEFMNQQRARIYGLYPDILQRDAQGGNVTAQWPDVDMGYPKNSTHT